jgi:hypothetical protein
LSLVADALASLNGRFPTLRYRVAFISSIGGCHYFDTLPYRRSRLRFHLVSLTSRTQCFLQSVSSISAALSFGSSRL